MTVQQTKIAITALQWTLGLVVLIEAILFVMPSQRHNFVITRMPDMVRQVLGWGRSLVQFFS